MPTGLLKRRTRTGWLLLLPMLGILAVVVAYPFLRTIVLSFTSARLVGTAPLKWVGLENYAYALTDPAFLAAIGRTAIFVGLSVSAEVIIGVLVALLLNREFVGRGFMRALIVLPWALPTVVNAMMWRLIYSPDFGALNAALTQLGLASGYQSWLGNPSSALVMVAIADIWKNFSIVALIALAALQTVPKDLYEAATIDGAGPWTRFWRITLPGIVGPLSVALVLRTIEAFKVFDIIYVMTRGGPANSTKTVSFFVYQEAFGFMRAGSGASYALIVVLIATVFISLYINLVRRQGQSV